MRGARGQRAGQDLPERRAGAPGAGNAKASGHGAKDGNSAQPAARRRHGSCPFLFFVSYCYFWDFLLVSLAASVRGKTEACLLLKFHHITHVKSTQLLRLAQEHAWIGFGGENFGEKDANWAG
jgi:hypothetical protein